MTFESLLPLNYSTVQLHGQELKSTAYITRETSY